MSNLVIVESPAKAKTIAKFLPAKFIVKSSYGHIRDLPEKEMGIDVKNDFQPTYIIPDDKSKIAGELKKAAAKSDYLYFATDEDREGEAIAWHLAEILHPAPDKIKRITFHEITKEAVTQALEHPRGLDLKRVDAQQARRILDRLVGYELSPFLWKKVARGLSAGRVQSVAVRLVVEREREIQSFRAQEYWSIEAIFAKSDAVIPDKIDALNLTAGLFAGKLAAIDGKTLTKFALKNKEAAEKILTGLADASYIVSAVESKQTKKSPPPPFITSSLQQEANRKLNFSAKQTMRLAQQLYEGVDLAGEGSVGLITYMRTDSLNLSEKFLSDAKNYLAKNLGASYALPSPRRFKTKSRTAQEAHEAIRPTEAERKPEAIKSHLSGELHKLYHLIWSRALASQMPEAIFDSVGVDIEAKQKKTYTFRATGQTLKFDGFLRVYRSAQKDVTLPVLEEKEKVDLAKLDSVQHFTEPPARHSDASLVKALEEYEIGRPSTYAPTISTITERGYVQRVEDRRLKPTDIAFLVNDILVEHFPQIVDYKFTAKMEQDLDEIAEGKIKWVKAIKEFYQPFKANLADKSKTLSKKELTEVKTEEVCEKCGKPMVIKTGRFGRFLACTGYPDCKNTKPINGDGEPEEPEKTDEKCPQCGAAMQVKHGRFGKFLSCSNYPDCKGIKKIEVKTGVKCPACGQGDIIEKRSKRGKTFYACNRYPDCQTAFFAKPVNEKCPTCGSQLVFGAKGTFRCSSKDCDFKKKQ